ncbi:MAG: amino acid ABC transporter substrate-binding protein [Chloroflexi bacterium]|nr:MAG: amino acid ABC transporter substrate-binding protein [Chloroflexota bacterium]
MTLKRSVAILPLLLVALAVIVFAACGDDDGGDATETPGDGTDVPTVTDAPSGSHSQVLQNVLDRGRLNCGVNDAVPGIGVLLADGTFAGFDIDFCKAIAAAVLGDADLVDYTPLSSTARLPAVQTGQVDVLIRNTTWTTTRDAAEGLTYATTTYYDGQGLMVRAADGFTSVDDLATAPICVLEGTTTEVNLADRLPDAEQVPFADNSLLQQAFIDGRCDGWTSDKQQLAGRRSAFPADSGGPEALMIFAETFSKEPLAPVTVDNDAQWSDIVNWVVIGTIAAEELGVTSANVAAMAADPPNIGVARLLGVGFDGGEVTNTGLDVDVTFMQDVLDQVGNYGEIYEANVTPIGIERAGTLNALWTEGGLMYSPPFK